MIWFVLRRLGAFLATMLATSLLVYWLLASTPETGDIGLVRWMGLVLTGSFGVGREGPVGQLLAGAFAVTLPLTLLALLLAVVLGALLGLMAARRPHAIADRLIRASAATGTAVPAFWLGMLLAVPLANGLHWLPAGGFVPWWQSVGGAALSLVLPAITLALPAAAALCLKTRDSAVAMRSSPWFAATLARGQTAQAAWRGENLRVVALALLRPIANQAAGLVAGAVVIENTFYLPGLGRLLLDAVAARDPATVRGAIVALVLLGAGAMFLIRISALWLDPRIRAEASE